MEHKKILIAESSVEFSESLCKMMAGKYILRMCHSGLMVQQLLAEFVRGADLLLADGLFPARLWAEGKPHLSAEKVALLARDNQVGQFIITHLNPALDPEELLREARAIRIDAHLAARFATYTV